MAAEEARRHIDEKIAEFERNIRHLKTERNALAPISQLPPEILSRIFVFVVGMGDRRPPVRFNFSHVSRLWRETALAAPNLWTELPMEYLDWAGVMLERSRMAPLTVYATLSESGRKSTKRSMFIKDILINHGSHLGELGLTAKTPFDNSLLVAFLKDTMTNHPLLHTLNISGEVTSLPVGWLAGLERLRVVNVMRCSIDWLSLPCNLTDLSIRNSLTSPSLSDFVDALRQMTALESLLVHDSLPSENAAAYAGKVILTRLRSLDLGSQFYEVSNIVDLFVIPTALVVRIECKSSPEQKAQVSSLASSISTLVSTMRSDTGANVIFEELSVSNCRQRKSHDLAVWSKVRSEGTDDLINVNVSFPSQISRSSSLKEGTILSELVHSFPVSNIRVLSIFTSLSDTILVDAFGFLTHISHISVHCSLYYVVDALRRRMKNPETSQFQIVFPKLTLLEVNSGAFSPDYSGGIKLERFQDMLMDRCEWSAPLQKLTLNHPRAIDERGVKLLREIVVNVDWAKYEVD